ncbi:MAG: peroxiredoxin [Cognaticolwellia sp.]|jgi:peroxiredoxin
MMKNIVLALLLICVALAANAKVIIKGTLTNDYPEADSIHILEHDGIALVKIKTVALEENVKGVNFKFEFKKLEQGFYFLGVDPNNVKSLILGKDKEVIVSGSCKNLPTAIVSSPMNNQFLAVYKQVQGLDALFNEQINAIRGAKGNAEIIKAAEAEMAKIDANRKKVLNETTVKNPFLGNFVSLYTYLSFQNNKKAYKNEIEYFGNEFFAFVNFADPHYNRIPFLYDKVRQYTQTLTQVNQPNPVQESFSNRLLGMVVQGSKTHKCVLAGIMNGYQQGKNQVLFAKYGEKYLTLFGKENPDIAKQLQLQVKQAKGFSAGGLAPDFAMNQVDGTELKLSDLRGKVVLVDFWASWCRPCRLANPEVVALYAKYKDQGFEILGISLDRNTAAWEKAIEKDNLTWYHVSDLKGWQNAAAQLYGVRSIPQTLLIDAEGKIIARNLKGAALEAKLKEIFE